LVKHFHGICLNIFGSGPDEEYYKRRAKHASLPVKFYGYIPNDTKLVSLLSRSDIGIATYIPDKENVSYFGDPSKIKAYFSANLPVITTDVFIFQKEITLHRAGIIVQYGNKAQLISAIHRITDTYGEYVQGVRTLTSKYNYKTYYTSLFTDV